MPMMLPPKMLPYRGLLDVTPQMAGPTGVFGLWGQNIGDVIDWDEARRRGLLHNPDLLQDQLAKRGAPVGGGSVTQFPFRMLDTFSKAPPVATKTVPPAVNAAGERMRAFLGLPKDAKPEQLSPYRAAQLDVSAKMRMIEQSERNLGRKLTASERAEIDKHFAVGGGAAPSAKDSAQSSFGGMPLKPTAQELSAITKNARAKSKAYKAGKAAGELDPAAFGKYAGKVNPNQSAATIDAQLAGNARALSEMSMKQQAQALTSKWGAYTFHAGMDPRKAGEAIMAMTKTGMSEQLIKFNLAVMKQKGLL